MHRIINRLQSDEHWRLAECLLRLGGSGLLFASYLIMRLGWWLEKQPPRHEGTPLEFTTAAIACAALSMGLAFSLEGSGLFRLQPRSPRGYFLQKGKRWPI